MTIDFDNLTVNSIPPSMRRGITDEEILSNYKEDMGPVRKEVDDRDHEIIQTYIEFLRSENKIKDMKVNFDDKGVLNILITVKSKDEKIVKYLMDRVASIFDALDSTEYCTMNITIEEV